MASENHRKLRPPPARQSAAPWKGARSLRRATMTVFPGRWRMTRRLLLALLPERGPWAASGPGASSGGSRPLRGLHHRLVSLLPPGALKKTDYLAATTAWICHLIAQVSIGCILVQLPLAQDVKPSSWSRSRRILSLLVLARRLCGRWSRTVGRTSCQNGLVLAAHAVNRVCW